MSRLLRTSRFAPVAFRTFVAVAHVIAFACAGAAAARPPAPASVHPVSGESGFTLVFEGIADVAYRVWQSQTPPKVVVDLEAPVSGSGIDGLRDPAIAQVRIGDGPLGTRVVIDLNYALPRPLVEEEPGRLRVVVPTRFRIAQEVSIARGVVYGTVRAGEAHGPVSVKYLKVDPGRGGIAVVPGLAGETFGRAGLRDIAYRAGAIAGINGGFFHWTGRPLGLFIQDGELVSEAINRRAAFGIDGNGRPFIERLSTRLWLETPYGDVEVDGINRPRNRGEIVVYTTAFGPLSGGGQWLFVDDGRIVGDGRGVDDIGTAAGSPRSLRGNSFALRFDPAEPRVAGLRPGDPVVFRYDVSPAPPGGVRHAIGGGPQLVRDGEIAVTGEDERFQPDVLLGRAPRSAVGITRAGQVLLVVVDGRDGARSTGATLHELAEWMIRLGAVSAMNLDGGGSSTLVANGVILNQPSDGAERPIATAILVFPS